jgi:hypothetical protein
MLFQIRVTIWDPNFFHYPKSVHIYIPLHYANPNPILSMATESTAPIRQRIFSSQADSVSQPIVLRFVLARLFAE